VVDGGPVVSGGEERAVVVLLVLLALLCSLNIYLLYRIWGLEHQLSNKVSSIYYNSELQKFEHIFEKRSLMIFSKNDFYASFIYVRAT
jgi:hypothetical protein